MKFACSEHAMLAFVALAVTAVTCTVAAVGDAQLQGAPRADVNHQFDVIFAEMRATIAANGLDPLQLPEDDDTFDITLFSRTVNGSVWVGGGAVAGLGTVHRTGNMTLNYGLMENELVVAGAVGLTGLEISYAGETHIGLMGSKFKFEFGIPFLSLSFETDAFLSQAEVVLAYCFVQDFSYSHMKLGGFGPVDTPLYELVVNLLLQLLNKQVSLAVEGVVCSLLQQAIQGSGQLTVM